MSDSGAGESRADLESVRAGGCSEPEALQEHPGNWHECVHDARRGVARAFHSSSMLIFSRFSL